MNPSRHRRRGFTLFEMVVVLLIIGVILAMSATITRGIASAQRRSVTATRLATIDAAIVNFVAQQKRMPCPADGTLASSNNNAGTEGARNAATGCTSLANSIVPWRALALTEAEVTDGWERRITYRVQPLLAADNGMDMSWCDPAGTEAAAAAPKTCSVACVSTNLLLCTPPANFLTGTASGRGLQVKNLAGTSLMTPLGTPHTGAAYVLVSHGETGGGAYINTGSVSATTSTDGTEEQKNYANVAYNAATSYYVDDSTNDVAGTSHFDDMVSRPSVLTVISKAGLGPRPH